MLTDEGTTIVKVFLHISTDEQRRRLQRRIDDPEKNWKFRKADLDDRAMWDQYRPTRYEDAMTETSTKWAPWHVVPGDRKWVRTVAVSELVVHALETHGPEVARARARDRGDRGEVRSVIGRKRRAVRPSVRRTDCRAKRVGAGRSEAEDGVSEQLSPPPAGRPRGRRGSPRRPLPGSRRRRP